MHRGVGLGPANRGETRQRSRDALPQGSQRGLSSRRRGLWRRDSEEAERWSLAGRPASGDRGGNISSAQRSIAMSRGLTYADLTAAEQLQYTTIVRHLHALSTGGDV